MLYYLTIVCQFPDRLRKIGRNERMSECVGALETVSLFLCQDIIIVFALTD
jgi:hypothetical protein